jgi:hypothetical protein
MSNAESIAKRERCNARQVNMTISRRSCPNFVKQSSMFGFLTGSMSPASPTFPPRSIGLDFCSWENDLIGQSRNGALAAKYQVA